MENTANCTNVAHDILHKNIQVFYSNSSNGVSIRKIYICAVCYRSFSRKTNLKRHVFIQKHFALGNRIRTLEEDNLQIELPNEWKYGNYHLNAVSSIIQVIIYDLHSKEQIVEWMAMFMEINKSKFVNHQSGLTRGGTQYVRYRCEHYNDPARKTMRKKRVKGTGCKCTIYFTLKRNLAEVKISNLTHNHSLTSAAVASFFKPTPEIEQIFLKMFENKNGPSEALNKYRFLVNAQISGDAEKLKFYADRSKMPDYDWVRHFYHKNFEKKYVSTKSDKDINDLKEFIMKNEKICSKEIPTDYVKPLYYDSSEQIEQAEPTTDLTSYPRMENEIIIIQPDIHDIDSASKDIKPYIDEIDSVSKDHISSGMTPEETEILHTKFEEFKKKWDDIFQIMNKNYFPEYSKGLDSMNKHLDAMISMPSKILPSLFAFNMNAGLSATKQIGINADAVSHRKDHADYLSQNSDMDIAFAEFPSSHPIMPQNHTSSH